MDLGEPEPEEEPAPLIEFQMTKRRMWRQPARMTDAQLDEEASYPTQRIIIDVQRPSGPSQRTCRLTRRNAHMTQEEDLYLHKTSSAGSADADGSINDVLHESSDLELEPEPEPEPEPEEEGDGKSYALRQRHKIVWEGLWAWMECT